MGVVCHLRPARRRTRAVRLEHGRTRPQPRGRSAGQHRDRRARPPTPTHWRADGSRSRALSSARPEMNSQPRATHIWPRFPRRSTTSTTATSRCGCFGSHRVRWVGGYGRMDSATGEAYTAACPTPSSLCAADAISHLNHDHAEALCAMAKKLGRLSRHHRRDMHRRRPLRAGPQGQYAARVAYTRVGYAAPIDSYDDLRSATVELARPR